MIETTNARRRGPDLPIRDKDLTTGADVRRVVAESLMHVWPGIQAEIDAAIERERQRIADDADRARARKWHRRLMAALWGKR